MSASSIVMMSVACVTVWGGAIAAILIALRADKKQGSENL